MDEGVTSFDLHRQRSFSQGQMYVPLSRITSLERMILMGNYNKTAITENPSAKQEYQRLRWENKFTTLPFLSISEMTLKITLLNMRSYERSAFFRQWYIVFSWNQLQIDKDTSVIESRFQEHFKLHFNSNENKFRSIAFCYLNRVSVLGHEDRNAISIIAITKP